MTNFSSENRRRLSVIATMCAIGVIATALIPAAWFPEAFLWSVGAILVIAVLALTGVKELEPLAPGLKILTCLAIGKNRSTAPVTDGIRLLLFFGAASFVVGLCGAVLLLNAIR